MMRIFIFVLFLLFVLENHNQKLHFQVVLSCFYDDLLECQRVITYLHLGQLYLFLLFELQSIFSSKYLVYQVKICQLASVFILTGHVVIMVRRIRQFAYCVLH